MYNCRHAIGSSSAIDPNGAIVLAVNDVLAPRFEVRHLVELGFKNEELGVDVSYRKLREPLYLHEPAIRP